jgi:6-phosphogluconolactonase
VTEIRTFADETALARAAAADWLDLVSKASGPHLAAFSGGRIAKTFFAEITAAATKSGVSLGSVEFFWADERCVPPNDTDSNFLLAEENLFRPMKIAPHKTHRLKGEMDPKDAVAEANDAIRRIAPRDAGGIPVLDIVFLGIGPDGHTASLMPNAHAVVIQSREPFVHVDNSPKPPPNRISMTYPVLAAAKQVWALVSGDGKAEAFRESLRPDGKTPFGRVLQSRKETRIYSDIGAPG